MSSLHDVMISYRVPETGVPCEKHPNADNSAHLLAAQLKASGYTVFVDVDVLRVR